MKDTDTSDYEHLSAEEMQVGLHVAKVGLGSVDYVTDTVKLDRLAAHMFDLPYAEALSRADLHGRIHPEDWGVVEKLVTELLDPMDADTFDATHRVIRPNDGSVAWLRVRKKIWFQGEDDSRTPEKAVFAVVDITAEKQAKALSETLIGELRHRGKNVVTVISGIARQLSRHSEPYEFYDKFMSRLSALSRNMYEVDPQGRTHSDMHEVFKQQIEPFADHADRITIEGPDVYLPQDTAQILAMVAHELLTNAAKYGALSSDDGTVAVDWGFSPGSEGDLVLSWVERDGPEVVPPVRKGYGSQVVSGLARMSLQARVEVNYLPKGVDVRLVIPKNQISRV